MSSLEKMLGLLGVFTTERPIWSSEDLIQHSGAPASTCYRYLKVLHTSGYLARVANGSYVLGPRIMELDRVSRESDPVYIAGSPVGQRLTHDTGHSSLLCILFSDSIMCVQQARGRNVPAGLFNRGQRRPLVAGASAKSILAHLPMHQLRILYARHSEAIGSVGLGADWEVLGSLALAASNKTLRCESFRDFAPVVMQAAQEVSAQIASNEDIVALPARALG
jgi:DNA-binding IclR family transcriptional regulator